MSADGSSIPLPQMALPAGDQPAIAQVICAIEVTPDLSPRRRAEICSACRTLCAWLGSNPVSVPADPRHLRKCFESLSPAKVGVGQGRFNNVRSLVLKGLKCAGIRSMPGRARDPLAPEWEALRALLPDRHCKYGLSRLMSFCTSNGVLPENVDGQTFKRFREAYANDSLLRDPGAMYHDTAKLWNQAATTIPGWPTLEVEVPDRRHRFALPLDHFPATFEADLEAYLSERGEPDVFDDSYRKAVKPRTLIRKRQNLMMVATALARTGFPVKDITGIDVLVAFDNAKAALKFLLTREGGTTTDYLYQIATELKTVARSHVGVPEAALERLRALCRRLKPKKEGFTEKNKRFLRQFADQNNLAALLLLPRRLVREAPTRKIGPRRQAVLVELAVAIAIELVIPVRVDDLADIQLDRHLHRIGHAGTVFLAIPAEETKNGVAVEAMLPPRVVEILDLYLERFRPRLLKAPSPWLFPGENGERRVTGGFSAQIGGLIWKETGIEQTTHQFRHLAAKLFLDRHPGDYETVRRLLGHKSRATTERFYCELDRILAVQQYNDVITQLLAELETETDPEPPGRPRKR